MITSTKINRFIRLTWLLILLSSPISGQIREYERIGLAEGLSQGMVFDMVQDREGFLWIGTKNGLNRYDGYNFKIFLPDASNPFSISDNQASALFWDSHDRLWVGTASHGINLFDRSTHRFYHCDLRDKNESPKSDLYAGDHVTHIGEDPDGAIWAGTTSGKLFKVILPGHLKKQFPSKPDFTRDVTISTVYPEEPSFNNRTVKEIYRPGNNKMWVSIGERLYRLDYAHNRLIPFPIVPYSNLPIQDIEEDSLGQILIAKANHVFSINRDNALKTHYFTSQSVEKGAINIDKKGNIWGRRDGKVVECHYSRITPDFFDQEAIMQLRKNEFFTKILVDKQGTTWLSTNGYGIKKRSPEQRQFRNFLQEYSLLNIYEDREGRVFFWDYGSVYLLDKNTGAKSKTNILSEFGDRNKGNLIQDKREGYWIIMQKQVGRTEIVLVKLDKDLKKVKEYDLRRNGDWTNARLIQDRQGNIWISSSQMELLKFNPAKEQTTYYPFSSQIASGNVNTGVNSLYEDGQGMIWIATKTGLLKTIIQGEKVGFSTVDLKISSQKYLPENNVNALMDDPIQPKVYLWIGTWGGLIRLNKLTGDIKLFTVKDGLGDNTVAGILADDLGDIWISTFRGLSRLDIKSNVFSNYSSQDGLASDEFNRNCYFKNARNELLFGGISGLTVFKPDKFWKREAAPTVRIIDFRVNNQKVNPDDSSGILLRDIQDLPAISLAYDQNVLMFEFTTLDLNNSSKNRFRHQLVGVDKGWVEATTNRFANYSKLPPGSYTLKAIASFDGSVWSARPTELHLTIHPPWFRTWWANTIYFLLLAGLAYVLYRSQIRRVRLQEQLAYEHKVASQLLEMDDMKTKFFTNISHEFRTPLTLLIGPLEDLSKKYPGETIIKTMHRNANRLLVLIGQLLDLGKLESRQMQVQANEGDFATHIRTIASSFTSLAEKYQIDFNIKQSLETAPAIFDHDKVDKIITNLLSNAFKFTPAGKSIGIIVNYELSEKLVRIIIEDTGIGIAPEKLPKIFDRFYQVDIGETRIHEGTGIGLSLVKELVDLLGGKLNVESKLNEGTRFEIELPLQYMTGDKNRVLPFPAAIPIPALTETNDFAGSIEKSDAESVMLIVEDNVDLRNYMVGIFKADYRIIVASDGAEGIEKALEFTPDIVISDLMMPKVDGYELCSNLKSNEKTSHIPVIMLTAKADLPDRLKGLELGADDYLTKPFNSGEIKIRVKNLLHTRQMLRKLYGGVVVDLKPAELKVGSLDERFIIKAKQIVTDNIGNQAFDINQFSSGLNMTPSQLRRKLKALTGMTPVEFNRTVRLHFAASLLAQKADSVSNIAYASGFENLSYFSKAFQDLYGVTPSEYK